MALSNATLEMLEMLPIWMKMRYDPENSQGALLMDTLGAQIEDIDRLIENILTAHHLDLGGMNATGVDIISVDVLYKFHITNEVIDADNEVYGMLQGISMPLTQAKTAYDFYRTEQGVSKYYYDPDSQVLYTRDMYDSVVVNGAEFSEHNIHNVWGPYDEIGLLLGCPRLPGEKNPEYASRLKDVFKRPGNSSRQGLVNFLSRSFSVTENEVMVQELSDGYVKSLINDDGTLKAELKEYIKLSNRINLSDSNVYWDILEESRLGLSYLPMVWNVSLSKWSIDSIQNGIGHGDDLNIIGPEHENPIQNFTAHIGVEGLKVDKTLIYPEHEFKYKLMAKGQKYDEGCKPENFKYSIMASELVPLRFKVKAHKQYTHNINIGFDTSISDYTNYPSLTPAQKLSSYVSKGVTIVPGSAVMNPDNRYMEVFADLMTQDESVTPRVRSVTINYHTGATARKIVISGDSQPTEIDPSTIHVGFDVNTWSDASPVLKVRSDTNDMLRTTINENGYLELTKGEYQKIYDSEGDWDDGQSISTRVTAQGTLRLNI